MIIEKSNTGLSTIGISFVAGRCFQDGYINGTANLCSQVLYNGTKSFEKKHLFHLPMQYGGSINSGINDIFATFTIRGLDQKLPDMVDLISSMLFESTYSDIEKQKLILKELNTNTMNDTFKLLLNRLNTNMYDPKFSPLKIDNRFNSITRDDLISFAETYYKNPAISIVSGREDAEEIVSESVYKYNTVRLDSINTDFDYYTMIKKYDEFAWDVSTNNRMLLYFIVDHDPIYDVLASIYTFKLNKMLRSVKTISCRNRCIVLPHGLNHKLLVCDIEFSRYRNKDEIIEDVIRITRDGFTEKEFEISKTQRLGNLMYDACDPIKLAIFNSEKLAINKPTFREHVDLISNMTYEKAIEAQSLLQDHRYVLGTNLKS